MREPAAAGRSWKTTVAGVSVALAFLLPLTAAVAAESGGALEPGQVFRDCFECPEMVVVPAGSFRMGDLNGGGDADEGPVREVNITRPFAIAKYETTFAEWDACVEAADVRPAPEISAGVGIGGRRLT